MKEKREIPNYVKNPNGAFNLLQALTAMCYKDLNRSIVTERKGLKELKELKKPIAEIEEKYDCSYVYLDRSKKEELSEEEINLIKRYKTVQNSVNRASKNIDDDLYYFLSEHSFCTYYDLDRTIFIKNALKQNMNNPKELQEFISRHNFLKKYDVNPSSFEFRTLLKTSKC